MAKKKGNRKHPTVAMLQDLKDVFEKHNWSGSAIGLLAASSGNCPDGKTPQEVTYQLPDGTMVHKTVCV